MNKNSTFIGIVVLSLSLPACAQFAGGAMSGGSDQAMMAPAAVRIGGDSVAFSSELERSNYLQGGVTVEGAYDDNLFDTNPAEGDATYTISPYITFDIARSRLQWSLNYRPGFTIYQRFSQSDQSEHAFSTSLQYMLSPHVTLSLADTLAKSPSYTNLITPALVDSGSNTLQSPGFLVVPPLTSTLVNQGSGQITYQFARNAMIGGGGNSSELRFLDSAQAVGLFDSSERGGNLFYAHRIADRHYLGLNYTFADILTHPIEVDTKVQTATIFYSFYLSPRISFSAFGGADHSDTQGGPLPSLNAWSPTEGGGINVQGLQNSLAFTFSRSINPGGGLQSAVHSYTMNTAYRHQFTPHLNGGVQASYSNSTLLQLGVGSGGKILTAGASLDRQLGNHWNAELQYSRLHQDYSNIPSVSNSPDTDRASITVSYQFQKALGR